MTAAAYVNPFLGDALTPERIDQGVDYAGTGTVRAIGDAIVSFVGLIGGFGTYIVYQLTSGPHAGSLVYVAEGVTPTVAQGQSVKAGQAVARLIPGSSTGIETGWAQGKEGGYLPAAKISGGYKEGQLTAAGESFSQFLESLGAPGGTKGGRPVVGFFSDQTGKALREGVQAAKTAREGGSDAKTGGISNPLDPSKLAAGIVNDLIGWVKPTALKLLLYTVFIFGGVALAGYGLATMLKPMPPSLREGMRKAGKAAELGAAAA